MANARDPAFAPLRYEIVQGALVRWSAEQPEGPHPPTAVLIHGILGSRRNLLSFAKRLAQAFPSWQFVLVDLRCHGQTASMPSPPGGEHSVTSAARDVSGAADSSPLTALSPAPNSDSARSDRAGVRTPCAVRRRLSSESHGSCGARYRRPGVPVWLPRSSSANTF